MLIPFSALSYNNQSPLGAFVHFPAVLFLFALNRMPLSSVHTCFFDRTLVLFGQVDAAVFCSERDTGTGQVRKHQDPS